MPRRRRYDCAAGNQAEGALSRQGGFKLAKSLFPVGIVLFLFLAGAPCPARNATGDSVTLRMPMVESFGRKPLGKPRAPSRDLCVLGGPENATMILKPSARFIRRLVVSPGDLLAADFTAVVISQAGTSGDASLLFHRMLSAKRDRLEPGADYEAKPFLTARVADVVSNGSMRVPGFAEALRNWHTGKWGDHGFLLALRGAPGAETRLVLVGAVEPKGRYRGKWPAFELKIRKRENALLFDYPVKPTPGVYVKARAGKLFYGGKRLRLWGVARHWSRDLFTVGRLRKMGFNAIRLWGPKNVYSAASAKKGRFARYEKGDGSALDVWDRCHAEYKRRGIFVVCTSLHYDECGMRSHKAALPADDSWLAGGSDWDEWKRALAEKGFNFRYFKYFDERCKKIALRHAENYLNHVNLYTGKRYAEEEAIAVFEIDNENGFLKWVLERGFDKWPSYFRNKLRRKWNDFLRRKYKNTPELKKAWGGLAEGESLERNSVGLHPTYPERKRFGEKRASDFLRFLVGTIDAYNQDFRAHCRRQAPAGVGVNVIPFIFDTYFRNDIPWLYADARGDVNSFGIYIWSMTSSLTVPPSLYVVDSSTVAGKPSVLYEVNASRPSPYRTEFPMKLAALASRQDWDGVFFHYWHEAAFVDEGFLTGALPIVSANWADGGIYHANDPVMCSSLAAAGRIFLGGLVRAAENPTTFSVGRDGIFSYRFFHGVAQGTTPFSHGARIAFDTTQTEPLKVSGPVSPRKVDGAVRSGDVLWDWPNGRMIIDSPGCKAYVGATAPSYSFGDGIVLSGLTSPFVTFALVSADGKALAGECKRAYVSAVFDARNTGFDFDWSASRAGGGFMSPREQAALVRNRGRAPIVLDKVSYTLSFPRKFHARMSCYDFALRKIIDREIKDTNAIHFDEDEPAFMTVITFESRGGKAEPVVTKRRVIAHPSQRIETAETRLEGDPALRKLWNPIVDLSWASDYASTHQFLRDGTFDFSSISRFDPKPAAVKRILLSSTDAVLSSTANVEVIFKGARMKAVKVTFTKAPEFSEAARAVTKALGEPVERKSAKAAWDESKCRWVVKSGPVTMEVTLTEYQGASGLTAELR